MSFLEKIDPKDIDFGDVVFDVEAANRMADTVYDGAQYLRGKKNTYSFELDISTEDYEYVEQAYQKAYNMSVRDVIEVLLKQSIILGDCPFYPEVVDVTEKYAEWEEEIPDIDWRDSEAVQKFMDEEEEE